MNRKVLLLEGLPDKVASLKPKLELYFKNIRKSGGCVLEIRDYPDDKRKALLIYENDEDAQNVAQKRIHKVDFKGIGKVDLTVHLHGEKLQAYTEKETRAPPSHLNKEIEALSREICGEQEHVSVCQEAPQRGDKNDSTDTLLVSSTGLIGDHLLQLYFEQFSDDVNIIKYGENAWLLRLPNRSDAEKVLVMKDHVVGDVSINVALYDERAEEEKLDPRRFILRGFKDSCKCSLISVYIKSCSKGAEHSWEPFDDRKSLVVTFKQDVDIKSFLEKCSSKKLEDMEITASHLKRANTVLVKGEMGSISEEALTLYFGSKRSKGGEIRSWNWVNRTSSAIVTFKDWQVAHTVAKQTHCLSGVNVKALLFYTDLQMALTGETPLPPTVPSKITLTHEIVSINDLSRNKKFMEQFEKTLRDAHARVPVNDTAKQSELSLEMTVDQESLLMYHVAPIWESKARNDVQNLLKSYTVIYLAAEGEVWERIEDMCLSRASTDVSVFYDSSQSRILVVGQKNEANSLAESIGLHVRNVAGELAVQRNTVVTTVPLNSKEELDFLWNMVSNKLENVEISKDEENLIISLKGLTDPVSSAEKFVKEEQGNLATQTLKLSAHLTKFMKSLDLKKFEHDHFVQQKSQNGIHAVILNYGDSYKVLAEKKDIYKAEQTIMETLKEEVLELKPEQVEVTKDENWRCFFRGLSEDVSYVNILQSDKVIIITGFCSAVTDISRKLKGYLDNKLPVTEVISLESLDTLDFINDYMNLSEVPDVKVLGVTILPSRASSCLKITAASEKIQEAVSAVKKQIALIVKEKHAFFKAGEFEVLEKNQMALKAQAKELGCMLCFPTEKVSPTSLAQSYSYNIGGYITLTIAQGDLSRQTADVIVCPLSGNSAFDDPVAKQVLQVGGLQIKEVFTNLSRERNSLIAGDVVLSKPGHLSAKTLVYAGISAWGSSGHHASGQPLEYIHLKSATIKCITNAEDKQATSIAMPTLGCDTFNYPVSESCKAIMGAILECYETYSGAPQNLKKILIVDPDLQRVEEFNNTVKEMVAKLSATVEEDTRPSMMAANKQNVTVRLLIPPKPKAVLIGGITVNLKKGDIIQEKVDAIVNSTNSSLNLQTGVSGAILKAAGHSVIDECTKLGAQKADGVVVTGGGSLSCKYIIHMVGPTTTAGITASMEKVLQLCESKACAQISIPAIGTGRGKIGPKASLKAILKGLENHISKTATTCIRLVSIVAFEVKVFDCLFEYVVRWNELPLPKKQSREEQIPADQVKIYNVRVQVKKGNIINETVRGIVNTTNRNLNLKGGVSGAILRAAGQSVEDECQKFSPQGDDGVVVTCGGLLHCDFIIHVVGPQSCATVTSQVERALEKCEDNQITTVSFPAIGTGGGGLKAADVVTAMLRGFKNHLTPRASTVLKLVYIIIDRDEILQDFLQGLQLWKTESLNDSSDEEEDWSTASEDEDKDSSSSIVKVVMGPIEIKAFCGDITKETTDAIVSSTNTTLNLGSGVAGAILKAAGGSVVDECKALGTQPSDGMVITKAGRLPIKHIVHMVGQTTDKDTTNSMCKVLKACDDIKVQSVAFPALGTGAGNIQAEQAAVAMMNAIGNFLKDRPQPSVTIVHIVIFQTNMLSSFEQAMKNYGKVTPKLIPTAGIVKKPPSIPGRRQSQPSLDFTSFLASVSYPTMVLEVYGISTASLAQVKKCLKDLLAEECINQDVEAQYLHLLQDAEKQAIANLSRKHHLQMTVHSYKLSVSGKKDDVLMAVLQIKDFLQGAKERESQELEKERIRKTVLWEKVKDECWTSIDPNINYYLETAFLRKKKVNIFTYNGETFKADLEQMQMTDSTKTTFRIRRTPLVADSDTAVIQTPPTWTKMDGKCQLIVPVVPTSQEYQKILNEFVQSCQKYTQENKKCIEVKQIQRIQNEELWQSFSVRKQAINKKYPKNKNEQILYHGTRKDICQKINTNGFNRSFCGRNATKYGNGTYFAKKAYYSCYDTYSNPDENGCKYIYRARVLTGKPCLGQENMKEPTALDPNGPHAGLYDCAVDNVQNPFIFVIFCDSGAYPEYLITFKIV